MSSLIDIYVVAYLANNTRKQFQNIKFAWKLAFIFIIKFRKRIKKYSSVWNISGLLRLEKNTGNIVQTLIILFIVISTVEHFKSA